MKLTKTEQETYEKCLGQCRECLLNGECELQTKLEERKKDESQGTEKGFKE